MKPDPINLYKKFRNVGRSMYYPTENGVEKRIESWKIVIPLHDNQQEPFPEEIINSIKSKIITEFGVRQGDVSFVLFK